MRAFGWAVLSLVFVDEVLAAVAAGIWGHHHWGIAGAVIWPVVVIAVWWTFASPKAPLGSGGVRPVVKVLVFGLASLGLWETGREGWAIAFLVFSVAINALAQLPQVRELTEEATGQARPNGQLS